MGVHYLAYNAVGASEAFAGYPTVSCPSMLDAGIGSWYQSPSVAGVDGASCDFSKSPAKRASNVIVEVEMLRPIIREAFSLLGWLVSDTKIVYPVTKFESDATFFGGDGGGKRFVEVRPDGAFVGR